PVVRQGNGAGAGRASLPTFRRPARRSGRAGRDRSISRVDGGRAHKRRPGDAPSRLEAGLLMRAALLVLVGFCATASASEPDLFGMGARSGALAGAGAADAEGYDAAYLNPAGLVGPTRRRLTVGYVGARYHLSLLGMDRSVDNTDGLVLGADLPLPFGGVL